MFHFILVWVFICLSQAYVDKAVAYFLDLWDALPRLKQSIFHVYDAFKPRVMSADSTVYPIPYSTSALSSSCQVISTTRVSRVTQHLPNFYWQWIKLTLKVYFGCVRFYCKDRLSSFKASLICDYRFFTSSYSFVSC